MIRHGAGLWVRRREEEIVWACQQIYRRYLTSCICTVFNAHKVRFNPIHDRLILVCISPNMHTIYQCTTSYPNDQPYQRSIQEPPKQTSNSIEREDRRQPETQTNSPSRRIPHISSTSRPQSSRNMHSTNGQRATTRKKITLHRQHEYHHPTDLHRQEICIRQTAKKKKGANIPTLFDQKERMNEREERIKPAPHSNPGLPTPS